MPADYWYNPEGTWRFHCKLMPSKIKKMHPGLYEAIKQDLNNLPDDQWDKLVPTCGCRFRPWANGASKVVELRVMDKSYAILAERLPVELDDEIKKAQYAWHKALARTTAEQIAKAIPTCLPTTNLCTSCQVRGISKFDFDAWKADGRPTLTRAGWIALCRVIAMNQEVDLSGIISLCDKLSIDIVQNPDLKTALQMSRGRKPTKFPKVATMIPVDLDDDVVDV